MDRFRRKTSVFRRMLVSAPITWLLCALIAGVPCVANGQPSSDSELKTAVATFKGQIASLEASADLDPSSKSQAIEFANRALAAVESELLYLEKIAQLTTDIAKVDESTSAAKAGVSEKQPATAPPASATLKELDNGVQQRVSALESQQLAVSKLADAIASREQRLIDLPQAITAALDRVANIEEEMKSPVAAGESQQVTEMRQAMLKQQRRTLQREKETLKKENEWLLATGDLLPLQSALAQQRLDALKSELEMWQAAAAEHRKSEVNESVDDAVGTLETVSDELRPIAERNLAIAKQREAAEQKLKEAVATQVHLDTQLTSLKQQLARAQSETQSDQSMNESLGMLLREQRSELPDLQELMVSVKARQTEVSNARTRLFLLREEEAGLSDLERATAQNVAALGVPNTFANEVTKLLKERKELLEGLTTDENALFETLAKSSGTEANLIAVSKRYTSFIDERVLWIRSSPPFGIQNVVELGEPIFSLSRVEQWLRLGTRCVNRFWQNPIVPLIALIGGAILFLLRFRLRTTLRDLGRKAESGHCVDFGLTLRSIFLVAVISGLWAGAMYFLAMWLKGIVTSSTDLAAILSSGLIGAAATLYPLELWRQSARPKSLMLSHFGRSEHAAKVLHSNLCWLTIVVTPLVGLHTAIQSVNNPIYERSWGRISFALSMVCFAVFLHRIAHPDRTVLRSYLASKPDSLINRSRHIWFPLLVATPILLAVLSLVGYHFTAIQLAVRLNWTWFLLLAVGLLYATALRWALLNRRRLSIEQARALRAQNSELVETGLGSAEADIQEIDLDNVSLQTRRLIRALTLVVGAVALWSLWVGVLPALQRFDDIEAWKVVVPVSSIDAAQGEGLATGATSITKSVSYAQVGLAILILLGTFVATRDLPGLLELTVLQHLPMDVALRFAIKTLTRYVLFIAGLIWAFNTIDIGWSKVQWLVAAVSVGLGFGLQEIFANFVSGLIILFERPLRTGDIVTIDGVTGTVKNVRLRSTLIQDMDRKDFIVPNKDFITGRLLNWTLSDEVNRIVIVIGVAYGCDLERAKALLLEVAESHPLIVKKPGASVTFDSFGDNALQLTLRCYISMKDMSSRLQIVDELHTRLDKSYREADIEIPFPQRDVHVRSGRLPAQS